MVQPHPTYPYLWLVTNHSFPPAVRWVGGVGTTIEGATLTTINETVTAALQERGYSSYMEYARPVVQRLVDREHNIVGELIRFGTQNGLSEQQVTEALRNCGMEVPQPEAESETEQAPTAEGDLTAVLSRIENTLSGLTQFARDNGYRG